MMMMRIAVRMFYGSNSSSSPLMAPVEGSASKKKSFCETVKFKILAGI